jgi:hypothetical protein
MDKLLKYLQDVIFSRFVEDAKYYVPEFIKMESEGDAWFESGHSAYTEQCNTFSVQYQRRVSIKRIDETRLEMNTRFSDIKLLTPSGMYISELESFSRHYIKYEEPRATIPAETK